MAKAARSYFIFDIEFTFRRPMNLFAYVGFTALGLLFSFMGLIFAMTGGSDAVYVTVVPLFLTYAGAIFYVIKKAKKGDGAKAAFVLALPMPLVSAMHVVFLIGSHAVSFVIPDSEAFNSECETAGAQFFKAPSAPVRSIAYYRETKYDPPFTKFSVTGGTRITSLSYSNPTHPASIEFIETGPSSFGDPYSHHLQSGQEYGVAAITADALVNYKLSPEEELRKAPTNQGVVKYEVTVVDRRTNETLASLRYLIDSKNGRACGLTGKNVMNERSFVLKAIGLP